MVDEAALAQNVIDLSNGELFSHGAAYHSFNELKLIPDYLNDIGTQLDSFDPNDSSTSKNRAFVLLYDFSKQNKDQTVVAKDYQMRDEFPDNAWSSFGTMNPTLKNE